MKVEIPSLEALYNKYTLPKVGDWIEVVRWNREYASVDKCFRDGDMGKVLIVSFIEKNIVYGLETKVFILFFGEKIKSKL